MPRIAMLALCLGVSFAAPAMAQSKAAIQKLEDGWGAAFNKGDAAAVAAMYTDDADVLPPGSDMVKGRSRDRGACGVRKWQQIGDVKCVPSMSNRSAAGRRAKSAPVTFKTKAQPPQEGSLKYAVVWERAAAAGSS